MAFKKGKDWVIMNQKNHWIRIVTLTLCIALLLSGCSGGGSGGSDSSEKKTDVSSSSLSEKTGDQSEEPEGPNYYKYNTYLNMLTYLNETVTALDTYFTIVEYQDEFQLVEGESFDNTDLYWALFEVLPDTQGYMDTSLELSKKEPYYEELDTIVQKLVPAAKELQGVLSELHDYVADDVWEQDSYSGAAELHARLMSAADPFLSYLFMMDDCIDAMEEQLNAEELERMLQNGEMISYYNILAIQQAEKVVDLICKDENYSGEALYIQNLEELAPACEELRQTLAQLTEALNDKEQRKQVPNLNYSSESESDTKYFRYSSFLYRIDNLNQRMDELLEYAAAGDDVAYKSRLVANGYSDLIESYNTYVVG